jgi:hypothetical protein
MRLLLDVCEHLSGDSLSSVTTCLRAQVLLRSLCDPARDPQRRPLISGTKVVMVLRRQLIDYRHQVFA